MWPKNRFANTLIVPIRATEPPNIANRRAYIFLLLVSLPVSSFMKQADGSMKASGKAVATPCGGPVKSVGVSLVSYHQFYGANYGNWLTFNSKTIPRQSVRVDSRNVTETILIVIIR